MTLISYAVTGGSPPPTLESLRVAEDGTARAIVTSPWPSGSPLDEGGVYSFALDEATLDRLRAIRLIPGEYGTVRGDSGRVAIRLASGDKVAWSPFADPPAEVAEAEAVLRSVLGMVREHPLAAVRLQDASLRHVGSEPVGLTGVGVRVGAYDGDGVPPIGVYREAAEVATLERAHLADGDVLDLGVSVEPGSVVFATATFELPDSAPLRGFLVSRD